VTTFSSPPLFPSTTESVVWHFDDFVLDVPQYELRRNGVAIRMEPQVFDVMTHLVNNHQRLVTKNELFDTVWGGRFVGDAALTSRIKVARRILGDDGESQRYIRTIRGRGYRFVGTIDRAVRRPVDPHRLASAVA
jgi:DNA-binding winged helix-turn-helix (wHTH) protein